MTACHPGARPDPNLPVVDVRRLTREERADFAAFLATLALLADHPQPRGVPAALGGRVGLAETLIHHQDVRRGLAQLRQVPAERLLPALRMALIAPDIGGLTTSAIQPMHTRPT